jgi:ABC-type nitrate/sulfonate/bicarbonate transport system ATPase subunit
MLEAIELAKTFDLKGRSVPGLLGVNLSLEAGSFTAIVGRSGCGKSTLLRVLAGLLPPTTGSIHYRDAVKPTVGFVFQEPRLMPWLTVSGNIMFGLRRTTAWAEAKRRTIQAIELVGLEEFRDAYPDQLSGGMASRVGLARALAMEPQLLLLDEPFAALDTFTRSTLQQELCAIWHEKRSTIVFVTHDVEEACLLAQRVIQMHEGRMIAQVPVALPFPRDPTSPDFVQLRRRIIAGLNEPDQHGTRTEHAAPRLIHSKS